MSDPTPAPTGPTTTNPAPAAPAAPETPAHSAPATTNGTNGGDPMKYVWPLLAGIALVALFILGWRWLGSSPTSPIPVVVPNGQTAPAQGQPAAPGQPGIEINIQNIQEMQGKANLDKYCGHPNADCRKSNTGSYVGVWYNGQCLRTCYTKPNGDMQCTKPGGIVEAKPETWKIKYVPSTIVVQQPAGNSGDTTATGGSPVASISTGPIQGMRDFIASGFSPSNIAHAAAPRDTIAYNGPINNNPVISNDIRPSAVAVAETSNNQQQTTVVQEGDTYIFEGDTVYSNTTYYVGGDVYNTYFMDGDTYFIPPSPGVIYILIGRILTPVSDTCAPGGVCEQCRINGDCPKWLNDRCAIECPVGPGPTSIPPTAVPPTPGPGPSATPITPVPPTPGPSGCWYSGKTYPSPQGTEYQAKWDRDCNRLWQNLLGSVSPPSDKKAHTVAFEIGKGSWRGNAWVGNIYIDDDCSGGGSSERLVVNHQNDKTFDVNVDRACGLAEIEGGEASGFDIWRVGYRAPDPSPAPPSASCPVSGQRYDSPQGDNYDAIWENCDRLWQPWTHDVVPQDSKVRHTVPGIRIPQGNWMYHGIVATMYFDPECDGSPITLNDQGNGMPFEVTVALACAEVSSKGGEPAGFDIIKR